MNNILAIGAHPDDVEFGSAGTLAKFINLGKEVTILCMTDTGVTDLNGNVLRTASQSKAETALAAQTIGANLCQLSFKDQSVPFNRDTIFAIEKQIVELGIDTIFTHWSGDSHQDHINTLKSVLAAARHVDNIFLYEQVPLPRVGSVFPSINYYVDISHFYEIKKKSILCHRSQISRYEHDILRGTIALAEYRGAQCGCKYAEGFHCLKQIQR